MALNLVTKFRDLAAVEGNRAVIVRDQGCLPLLLSHVSSSDSEIVVVALEGINFLSMCPENRPLMRKERGLTSLIQILKTHSRPEIAKLAKSIITQLDNSNQENESRSANTPSQHSCYNSNASTPSSTGQAKKRARTVTLYATGLSTEIQRKVLSDALLNVKGVISFLIDMHAQKVVIRTLTTPNFLVETLIETTQLNISLKPPVAASIPSSSFPSYLPDSDDEEEEPLPGYGTITKKPIPGAEQEDQSSWGGGWGLGRIAKALWG
mmetsp:Transcript_131210/g.195534  ORF Transcript_131210/g.195534 Transcript_131210/m.195534 type:complete len:266 (-) Transcript_131210:34-831(-)|eukprot:CAMPEP_0117039198 /NCGR_PEP_ID=MMETSP0472-20121206/27535_1 /TAXON_ID=693140 ORGANISM="Tiarina fusus, Strain LIS" /NCGR_SAMPLE_ID=MMETSP0472 /ASSEMBLY_ACC=CAM_ASM_000603 /LENGTH=265 /DNA_ID=CAMNT_0004749641 /DNA_START=89 /DNA_END=886 /DNA_ORIENTATION=-